MRVSIWEQWSGNHSSDFLVVGTFATPESATAALSILREYARQNPVGYADHVEVWDRLVFLWKGSTDYPPDGGIHDIMRLGGTVSMEESAYGTQISVVRAEITCRAPDTTVAITIYDAIKAYLTTSSILAPPIPAPLDERNAEDDDVTASGAVHIEGIQVSLNLYFDDISAGLPALVTYLAKNGCTAITYNITEARGRG